MDTDDNRQFSTPTTEGENPLIEGKVEYVTRWWIQATYNTDCYDLFIVRYDLVLQSDGQKLVQRLMCYTPYTRDEDGLVMGSEGWTEYQEQELIQPAYRFPGHILHLFLQTGLFLDRESVVDSLKTLAIQVFESVANLQKVEDDA